MKENEELNHEVTVTYWPGRGRAEPIRVLLAACSVNFKSNYIKRKADLENIRSQGKLDYNQVPLVEMDGLNLVQTAATIKYIAKKFGLYPTDARDQYLVDEIYGAACDLRSCLMSYPFHLDKDRCKAQFNFLRYCGKWENIIEKKAVSGVRLEKSNFSLIEYTNKSKLLKTSSEDDHEDSDLSDNRTRSEVASYTLADIVVFEVLEFYREIFGSDDFIIEMKPYPLLMKLFQNIESLGGIAKYIQTTRKKEHVEWGEYAKLVRSTLT